MGCGGSKQTAVDPKGSPRRSPAKGTETTPRGKYVVNGSANQSQRSDSVFSEATDKGFKRRVREKLKEATQGKDIDELDKAMDRFKRHKLDDCGDWTKAVDRMEMLTLRRDLRDAVRRSHVGVLEKTIKDAENSQYAGQLENQIEACRRKLTHLKELNTYKHDIMNMEQNTISEIHSYQRPPACVHDVMAATYMLLGYQEKKLMDWNDITPLMCSVGRDSLIHQVQRFDSSAVDEQTANRVQDILRPHELHTIRQASNGAAAFYVWSTNICEKVERDKADEDERLRKEEMEKQKQEERDAKSGKKNSPRKPKG
ncbi:uncharacterized protein [Littorina saxatilis]|uniref:Uncharacterized protein n=1 Tax=Littorina saxatilis TaxID=31220 RepID=A0AAN9C1I8_9CAEN